ncbi:MAG: hypothetical protein FI687_00815 [SAR202 cluster bacterium]|nr:hypothetical protein [SAR202 cluster bacterium]
MTIKRLPYRIRNQINSMVLLGADVNVIQDWLENKGHPRTLKRCYEYINDFNEKIKSSEDDFIDWKDIYRISQLNIDSTMESRIRNAIAWHQSFILIKPPYSLNETYRFAKWARYILNATNFAIIEDMDLWVLSKVFEIFERSGNDMEPLESWLTFMPFQEHSIRNEQVIYTDNAKRYIAAIRNEIIKPLDISWGEIGLISELTADHLIGNDFQDTSINFHELDIWAIAGGDELSQRLFNVGELFEPFLDSPLKNLKVYTYLLPSQQLQDCTKLDIRDRQRSLGNVKGSPVYMIDLDEYGDQSPDIEPIIYD